MKGKIPTFVEINYSLSNPDDRIINHDGRPEEFLQKSAMNLDWIMSAADLAFSAGADEIVLANGRDGKEFLYRKDYDRVNGSTGSPRRNLIYHLQNTVIKRDSPEIELDELRLKLYREELKE